MYVRSPLPAVRGEGQGEGSPTYFFAARTCRRLFTPKIPSTCASACASFFSFAESTVPSSTAIPSSTVTSMRLFLRSGVIWKFARISCSCLAFSSPEPSSAIARQLIPIIVYPAVATANVNHERLIRHLPTQAIWAFEGAQQLFLGDRTVSAGVGVIGFERKGHHDHHRPKDTGSRVPERCRNPAVPQAGGAAGAGPASPRAGGDAHLGR